MPAKSHIRDLHGVEGQAELIGGRIVRLPFHGYRVGLVVGTILKSLFDHARSLGRGEVFSSTLAYTVPELPSGRESFCPDASYYDGPLPDDPTAFISRAPTFAVEVRDESEAGADPETDRAAKRADYFAAGTKVVWDVDPEAEIIRSYRPDAPDAPTVFGRGAVADAEPAVPGWRVEVDRIFG